MTSWCPVSNVLCLCVAAVLCALALSVPPRPVSAAMDGVEPIQLEGKWGWAGWSIMLPDGRLMAWWTEGKKLSEAIEDAETLERAYARYSSDNGCTWSEPEVLLEFPKGEGHYGGSSILRDRDGGIHLFGIHYFSRAKSLVFHVMSPDGGKTWTPPQYCDFGHEYCGGLNSVFQLSSGRLVLPVGYKSSRPHGWFDITMSLSDDGGKTWRVSREEPSLDHISLDEAVGVQLKDGRLWLLLRTGKGYLYEAYSPDGETWTKSQPSRFVSPSAPGGAVRLGDGRIVVAWNNCLKPSHVINRRVLAAAISDDEGQTWRGYREIARTSGAEGHEGIVTYPWLTETADGAVLVSYGNQNMKGPIMVRVDPDWLAETSFYDDFSEGLDNWITLRTEGATVVAHPDAPERQVLRLRKPKADVAAGGSLNFPFGAGGELTMKLLLQPGFQGARICLTDHFTWPYYAEDGRFGISIAADGQVSAGTGEDEFAPTDVALETRKWYMLGFVWDCEKGSCNLTLDDQPIADLPQLSQAEGVCYLRLLSTSSEIDRAGLVVDSVSVCVQP